MTYFVYGAPRLFFSGDSVDLVRVFPVQFSPHFCFYIEVLLLDFTPLFCFYIFF